MERELSAHLKTDNNNNNNNGKNDTLHLPTIWSQKKIHGGANKENKTLIRCPAAVYQKSR